MGARPWVIVIAVALLAIALASGAAPEPKPATFQQYASSNGVSLHTGDLNLEIPLMTVPGRSGLDYPISLNYRAGVAVGQEASPVGLGWELSSSVITRDVEGIPDDYCASCVNDPYDANYGNAHRQPLDDQSSREAWASSAMTSLALSLVGLVAAPPASLAALVPALAGSAVSAGMSALAFNPEFSDVYNGNEPYVYHAKQLDGFSWRDMSGSGLEGHDFNSPDVYTVSGDYATGRLLLVEPKETDDHLNFHFQKTGGHSTNIEDNSNCNPSNNNAHNCRDTFYAYAERDSSATRDPTGKGEYTAFHVIGPDGMKYKYEPTEWFVGPSGGDVGAGGSDFVRRQESNDGDSCDQDSRKYLKTDFKWKYATEFGLTEIVSYDGDGTDDKGSYVKFAYDTPNEVFHHRSPYDPADCVTGPNGRKAWSESYKEYSYLSRIDTPTHYAAFEYANDRHDSKEYAGTKHPRRLASISLYYKGYNGDRLLQKIIFYYHYNLMNGAPDSDAGYGKLTLDNAGVYYGDNGDNGYYWGRYQFQYANGDAPGSGKNPNWSLHKRDRWGYYCGNCVQGDYNLDGADVASMDLRPDAWSLTKVTWPAGGWTEYFHESDRYTRLNSWYPNAVPSRGMEKDDTHYGGGARVERVKTCDGLGSCSTTKYLYNVNGLDLQENDGYSQAGSPGESSGVATNEPPTYSYQHSKDDRLFFGSSQSAAYVGYANVTEVPGFDEASQKAPFGFVIQTFTTAREYPNTGGVQPYTYVTSWNGKHVGFSSLEQMGNDGGGGAIDFVNEISVNLCPTLWVVPDDTELDISFYCGGWLCGGGVYSNMRFDDPAHECGWAGEAFCWSMDPSWFSETPDYTKYWVDNDNHKYFEQENSANVDTCCPDVDNNDVCDIMEVPPERRFSGSKDNDSMRGLEVSTLFYSSAGVLVKNVTRRFSEYVEPNPAGLLDLYSKWAKLDWEYVVENGVATNTSYSYSKQSALAGTHYRTNVTGSGEDRLQAATFAFEQYSDMLEVEPGNFHHLYSPVYETRTYRNTVSDANKWAAETTAYARYSNNPDGTPNWNVGPVFRPRQEYSWQKNDSVYSPILVKEYAAYDDYGHGTQYYDANRQLHKAWYKDNDYPCGENQAAPGLHYALPTCEENPLGQKTEFNYNDLGLSNATVDANLHETRYAYDNMNRLKYFAPPHPLGGTPYSTKIYTYYLYSEGGLPLSWNNLNHANVSALLKWSPYASQRKYANSSTLYDGLGRSVREVLVDDDGPDVWADASYNPLGKPERSYLGRYDNEPLDPARSVLTVYENNSLARAHYQVPVGVTPSWVSVQSLPVVGVTASGDAGYDSESFTATWTGYRQIMCVEQGDGSGVAVIYDGAYPSDPVLYRCDNPWGSDYAFFLKDRIYFMEAWHSGGSGLIGVLVQSGQAGLNAGRAEHSYWGITPEGVKNYFRDIGVDTAGNISMSKRDKFGRVVEARRVTDPSNPSADAVTSFAYDVLGRKTSATDANGLVTSFSYDRLGRVMRAESLDAGTLEYAYDPNGNLVKRSRNGQQASYSYDAANRLQNATYPVASQNIFYTYDEAVTGPPTTLVGRLHFVNAPTQITEYGYNSRGETVFKKVFFHGTCNSQGISSGCPDITGEGVVDSRDQSIVSALLARLAAPGSSVPHADPDYNPFLDFDRDGSAEYSEAQQFLAAIGAHPRPKTYVFFFFHDDQGHRNQTVYPSGFLWEGGFRNLTWKNEYDSLQRLVLASMPGSAHQVSFDYTADGLPLSEAYSGGASASYSYNARNLLETHRTAKDAGVLFQEAYEYDGAANLKSLYVGGGVGQQKAADFYYTPLYALARVDSQTVSYRGQNVDYYGGDQSFTYDKAGNRLSANGAPYSYDAQKKNRLLNNGTCGFAYDGNGSIISMTCGSQVTQFQYDYDGRLSKVLLPSGSCEKYFYDEQGNRVKKIEKPPVWAARVTYYAYDGGRLAQELSNVFDHQEQC